MQDLLTQYLDIWATAQSPKPAGGRGRGRKANGKLSPHGLKKLRELILELAVRGKLVPQNSTDEPASVLLDKITKEKARLIKEGKIKKQKKLPEISEEEKPFELPGGWEWSRVVGVFDLQYGKALPAKKRNESGRVDVFGSNGIVGKHTEALIDDPCIVIGRKGSAGALNKAIRPSWTTDVAYFLVPPKDFDFDYTFLFLQSLRLDELGKGIKPGVNRNEAYMLVGAIPPTAEQHRIVAKVDELMALCDRLERQQTDSNATHQTLLKTMLATLITAAGHDEFAEAWQRIKDHFHTMFTTEQSIDQIKQTILQLAVMGKLVPQNPSDEPASVLLDKIAEEKRQLIKKGKIKKQKKLPKIIEKEKQFVLPEGWEWVRLRALSEIRGGKRLPKGHSFVPIETPYIYIQVTNMKRGTILKDNLKYISEETHSEISRYTISKDDLYITIAGTIGDVGIVPKYFDGMNLTENAAKIIFSNVDKIWLQKTLSSESLQQQFTKKTNQLAQPKLALHRVASSCIALPPLAEQHRIVTKVDELMTLCDTLKARLSEAQTTQIHLADAMVEQAVSQEADRDD